MNEKVVYWFRFGVKWFTPVAFFIIATWNAIWLAGVMVIFTLFAYAMQWQKIGETPNKEKPV
jgi:hypothetical protein